MSSNHHRLAHRLARRHLPATLLMTAALAATSTSPVRGQVSAAERATPKAESLLADSTAIEVIEQPFAVTPGTPFDVIVQTTSSSPIVAVSVAIHNVTGAGELDRLAAGQWTDPGDVVDRARYRVEDQSRIIVSISPSVDADPAPETLDIEPGVSALRLAVATADGRRDETTTFVNVDTATSGHTAEGDLGTSSASDAAPLPVAVVVGLPVELTEVDGHLVLPQRAGTNVDGLIEVLSRMTGPVAVHLSPGVLDRLLTEQPDRTRQLAAAMSGHQLLAEPILPLDPSFAAAANANATYTSWLRAGEDLAARALNQQIRRSVGIVNTPLSVEGAVLRRDLGTQMVVLSTEQLDRLPSGPGPSFDTTGSFDLSLGNSTTLEAMVPDPSFAPLMDTRVHPVAGAARIVAGVIFARQSMIDAGIDPARQAVILATPNLGLPDATLAGALTTFLSETDVAEQHAINDLPGRISSGAARTPSSGQLPTALVPTLGPGGLDLRLPAIGAMRTSTAAIASILPDTDPRPTLWRHQLDELTSTAFPNDSFTATLTAVGAEHAAIIRQIEWPSSYNVTVGSRQATLRLKLNNTGPTPLKVRLRMIAGADKINFPDNDAVHELPAASATEVDIPIEARTNGRIPVLAQLLAPGGDERVLGSFPVTMTVNGLNGLGYLISGAGALILGAWWVRHLRRARGERRAATLAQP